LPQGGPASVVAVAERASVRSVAAVGPNAAQAAGTRGSGDHMGARISGWSVAEIGEKHLPRSVEGSREANREATW
jgi:hypothetical protein